VCLLRGTDWILFMHSVFAARCQTQLKLTAVCKLLNAQIYGSDIIFGISVFFIILHNDRQFVCYNLQFSYIYCNEIIQSAGCSVQYVIWDTEHCDSLLTSGRIVLYIKLTETYAASQCCVQHELCPVALHVSVPLSAKQIECFCGLPLHRLPQR
jgi:hypothetical protein